MAPAAGSAIHRPLNAQAQAAEHAAGHWRRGARRRGARGDSGEKRSAHAGAAAAGAVCWQQGDARCPVLTPTPLVAPQELPELWLVNVYTPNSGEGLKRLDYRITKWDKALAAYIKVPVGVARACVCLLDRALKQPH
jgi:hypothetical protein